MGVMIMCPYQFDMALFEVLLQGMWLLASHWLAAPDTYEIPKMRTE